MMGHKFFYSIMSTGTGTVQMRNGILTFKCKNDGMNQEFAWNKIEADVGFKVDTVLSYSYLGQVDED